MVKKIKAASEWGRKGIEVALNVVNMVVGARRAGGCFPTRLATGNFTLAQPSLGAYTGWSQKRETCGSCVGNDVRGQRSDEASRKVKDKQTKIKMKFFNKEFKFEIGEFANFLLK